MALTSANLSPDALTLRTTGLTFRLERAAVSGRITRSIEIASSLELTIIDPSAELLSPRIVNKESDLVFEGFTWRLVQVKKSADKVTLVFEDKTAAVLRTYTKPRVARRSPQMTRVRFVQSLIAEARADLPNVTLITHANRTREPITDARKRRSPSKRAEQRDYGFGVNTRITVKHRKATGEQRRNIERVLDCGVSHRVTRKVLIAAVMTITQEASALNLKGGDRDSVGLFQQRPSQGWPASRDIERDATAFYEKAMRISRAKPGYALTELCQAVQVSAFPDAYAQWETEAERTVTAYMGEGEPDASGAGDSSADPGGRYEFTRGSAEGDPESTWDATQRMAEEVQWRRFTIGDRFYFISDTELMRAAPAMQIRENAGGIQWIDYDIDIGKPLSTLRFIAEAPATIAEPGTVCLVSDQGAADGRWLLAEWTRDIWSPYAEVQLTSPQKPLPEPAGETDTVTDPTVTLAGTNIPSAAATLNGTPRQRIVNVAKAALANRRRWTYQQKRPMARSMAETPHMDCSEFATLCFKDAGLPDPNGLSYNGTGNTSTLLARGRIVTTPQPGDLAHYGSGSSAHVAVYIGDGKVIGFGSTPISEHPARYRADFRCFTDNINLESAADVANRTLNPVISGARSIWDALT